MTSTEWYKQNPAGRRRKAKKDAEINKRPEQVKKRVESNAARRRARRRGQNIESKDFDHAVGGFVPSSVNRGRREKSRLKGSKRS
jgi:hypothetical protein